MAAITITDLDNAKIDVDHIAEIANSVAITATDRQGHVKDTISGAVYKITAFTDRGAWAALTSYAVKDLVSNGGSWYVAVVAHTSSAAFATDTATKWRLYQGVTTGDLSASSGSNIVGFLQAGTGTVARTVQDKAREVFSVKDFGALGDGSNDDTAEIQAAFDAAISSAGGAVYFPNGTYKITAALTIPFATGWRIFGQSRGGTTIKQYTADTPIFKLTGDLTHSWEISELYFDYNTAQTSAQTQSACIYFSSANTAATFFNFQVRRCTFNNCYRGIASDPSKNHTVWGLHAQDLVGQGTMTGALLRLASATPIGQPNINVDTAYIDASNAEEPSVYITAGDQVTCRSVEVNNGSFAKSSFGAIYIPACPNLLMIGCKSESYACGASASTSSIFNLSQSYATVINCSFNGFTGTGNPAMVSANSDGKLAINGLHVNSSMASGMAMAYVASDIVMAANVSTIGFATTNITAYLGNVAVPRLQPDVMTMDKTATRGDVDLTMVATDYRVQLFNTTLTANRTVNLPTTGIQDGTEFYIVRKAATPGAFTLAIVDSLSGVSTTFASGNNGWAHYRAYSTGAWTLLGTGVL